MSTTDGRQSKIIDRERLELSTPYLAPAGEFETLIANTFAEAFDLDRAGVDDDFFELGGDSLIAEVLAGLLSERTGRQFTPAALPQYASVRQIARLLRANQVEPISRQNMVVLELEKRIRDLTTDWEGDRAGPNALTCGLNRGGKERPLFWCFQTGREFSELALHLGPERPLYGMRSGHHAMTYTKENIAALAQRYIDDIFAIDEAGPYLIGGNCQGGTIAVEIARQLQRSGRQVSVLALLDTRPLELFEAQVYEGKVALFFGNKSVFSPYRRFRNPELGLRKLLPYGLCFELLPADHGEYFTDRTLRIFAPKLLDVCDGEAAFTSTPSSNVVTTPIRTLPPHAYRAKILTSAVTSMRPGERRTISVEVANAGAVPWSGESDCGIAVGNHWLSADGEMLVWADGRTSLGASLAPGDTVQLDLNLQAPSATGDYLLELDLVEEGITWFKERRSRATIVPVTVLPGRKRLFFRL